MMNWLPRKTVVVPVDFSEDALAALDTARELVKDVSHLRVVHVLPVLEPADPGIIWHTIDDRSREKHARDALCKVLQEHDCGEVEIAIRFGDPGHEIVQYAQEVEAGLITVASHGRTGLAHILIGSVAERIVRLARCPVLVLKK